MEKMCDLAHIVEPSQRKHFSGEDLPNCPPSEPLLSLDLEVKPNTGSHLLRVGTYILRIDIGAANAKPVTKTIRIVVRGWHDDQREMFRDGIGITLAV